MFALLLLAASSTPKIEFNHEGQLCELGLDGDRLSSSCAFTAPGLADDTVALANRVTDLETTVATMASDLASLRSALEYAIPPPPPPAPPPSTPCNHGELVLDYDSGNVQRAIASSSAWNLCSELRVTMWGGGGATAGGYSAGFGQGGGGGYAHATLINPGTNLVFVVGRGGVAGSYSQGAWGGNMSAVFAADGTTPLAIAGGGGGGGGAWHGGSGGHGGGGGGLVGATGGTSTNGKTGGAGGSHSPPDNDSCTACKVITHVVEIRHHMISISSVSIFVQCFCRTGD